MKEIVLLILNTLGQLVKIVTIGVNINCKYIFWHVLPPKQTAPSCKNSSSTHVEGGYGKGSAQYECIAIELSEK
jgi:hypothetical protein